MFINIAKKLVAFGEITIKKAMKNYVKNFNNVFSIKMFILPIIEIFIFCALFYLLTDHAIIRWAVAIIYFCTVAFIQRDKIMTVLLPTLKGKFGK